MKRTRRIEIVRYTRRVTISEGSSAPAYAAERPAIDLNPVAPEGEDGRAAEAAEPHAPRQRVSRLRHLLRLGRSIPDTRGK